MAAPRMPDQLPSCIEYGIDVMPWWHVDMISLSDGRESPNLQWSQSRHEYELSFHSTNPVDYHAAKAHYNKARGMLKVWPFIDPLDNTVDLSEGRAIEVASGYQAVKRYGSGADQYDRRITRPFDAAVYESGVLAPGITIDPDTGLFVGLGSGVDPSLISWAGRFYVPVRYDIDRLPGTISSRTGEGYFVQSSGIRIVEVKE